MLRRAVLTAVAGLVLWGCTSAVVPGQSPGWIGGSRPADAGNADRAGGPVPGQSPGWTGGSRPADVEDTDRDGGPAGGPVAGTARKRACAAAQHGSIVGQSIDEIDTASLPKPLRVYAAGSPITMDYWPERMNVVVGADGRVVIVKCG